MKASGPAWIGAICILGLVGLGLVGCVLQEDKSAGSGDIRSLQGKLVGETGRPAAGAGIKALPAAMDLRKSAIGVAAASPPADTATVFTDAQGTYRFDSLPPGKYTLVGDAREGALVAWIGEVEYADGDMDLGVDTLRAPGMIRGRLPFLASARCYLPGTSYLAITDEDGKFDIAGVPQGVYSLRYSLNGYQAHTESGVQVRAGRVTLLPETGLSLDPALAPPAPKQPAARYDTARASVDLSWQTVPVSDLQGYIVFRDDGISGSPEPINTRAVTDTHFTDSVGHLFGDEADEVPRILTYRIKSVDRDANLSLAFSAPITLTAVPPSGLRTTLSLSVQEGTTPVTIGDTLRMVLAFSNPKRAIRQIFWYLDGSPDASRMKWDSALAGTDTLKQAWSVPGRHAVRVKVVDAGGTDWWLLDSVEVLLDPPRAFAGQDTLLTLKDMIHLHGTGHDSLGTLAEWAWDIGNTGVFHAVPGGDTLVAAPGQAEDSLPCVLRVTDDDGNAAFDTLFVRVIPDSPVPIIARIQEEGFTGDTLVLSGAASHDGWGRIVAWEWDLGGRGAFTPGDSTIKVILPDVPDPDFRCILRVTDDDGQSAIQEVRLRVRDRSQWIMTRSSVRDVVLKDLSSAEFAGRIWIAGEPELYPGAPVPKDPNRFAIWSSPDMLHWTQARIKVPPQRDTMPIFGSGTLEAFAGRLWMFMRQNEGYDVWSSQDGETWRLDVAEPDFALKYTGYLSVAVFGGKLWIKNGERIGSSADGINWSMEALPPALAIGSHQILAVHAGKLWLFEMESNSIWNSGNGKAWTRISQAALPVAGSVYGSFIGFRDRLWLFGFGDYTDMWNSQDGRAWSKAPKPSAYFYEGPLGRGELPGETRVQVFQDRLWMLTVRSLGPNPGGLDVWLAP